MVIRKGDTYHMARLRSSRRVHQSDSDSSSIDEDNMNDKAIDNHNSQVLRLGAV